MTKLKFSSGRITVKLSYEFGCFYAVIVTVNGTCVFSQLFTNHANKLTYAKRKFVKICNEVVSRYGKVGVIK